MGINCSVKTWVTLLWSQPKEQKFESPMAFQIQYFANILHGWFHTRSFATSFFCLQRNFCCVLAAVLFFLCWTFRPTAKSADHGPRIHNDDSYLCYWPRQVCEEVVIVRCPLERSIKLYSGQQSSVCGCLRIWMSHSEVSAIGGGGLDATKERGHPLGGLDRGGGMGDYTPAVPCCLTALLVVCIYFCSD